MLGRVVHALDAGKRGWWDSVGQVKQRQMSFDVGTQLRFSKAWEPGRSLSWLCPIHTDPLSRRGRMKATTADRCFCRRYS